MTKKPEYHPMTPELKPMPCPFCGSEDVEPYWSDTEQAAVACNNCRTSGPDLGENDSTDFSEAIKLWNTRTSRPAGGDAPTSQANDFVYLADHHHITETSIGFAQAHLKNGEYRKAMDVLDHSCVLIGELLEARNKVYAENKALSRPDQPEGGEPRKVMECAYRWAINKEGHVPCWLCPACLDLPATLRSQEIAGGVDADGLQSKIEMDIEDAIGRPLTFDECRIISLAFIGKSQPEKPQWWKDIEWLAELRKATPQPAASEGNE